MKKFDHFKSNLNVLALADQEDLTNESVSYTHLGHCLPVLKRVGRTSEKESGREEKEGTVMLKLDHIKKTFNPGTVNEKAAIRDLSLHLEPGDFATVIGSNGAGKSTMFAAIAGSFITDSGSITLNGKDITFAPEYQRSRVIGRLFQDPLKLSLIHI